jgi:hypothetical protein
MSGDPYTAFSRFTDPGSSAHLLDDLPESVSEICAVAERQTIHHNLLGFFGLTSSIAEGMRRVWPPRLPDILEALSATGPGNLTDDRRPEERVIGACMLESHFLAGLLRSRGIPTRIRAGYFQNVQGNADHIVAFWRRALRARGVDAETFEADPDRWYTQLDALSRRNIAVDHHIEHWICEYRDPGRDGWHRLDANRSFLKAHSDLDVSYELPAEHFEHAHEAWLAMRADDAYNPEQHEEEPQDGRSHIRTQLLRDFYSLLNHDIAGVAEADAEADAFITGRTYEETSAEELAALDELAALLSTDPSAEELVTFYRRQRPLRLPAAEADPYSLVFTG